jgi:hypothetical protein
MNAIKLFVLCLLLATVACLPGCQAFSRQSTKPTPPRVSDCLERPQGVYPPEPVAPKPGTPIPDRYVIELRAWGNAVLGVATTDRVQWRGERKCIRRIQEAGQIR